MTHQIQFLLRPIAGRLTTCDFAIHIDETPVWPTLGADDVLPEIQIDDVLSYLTDFWAPLMLRQVYPIDVSPLRPSDFRALAEARWTELPVAVVETEDEAVSNFEEAHDLSRSFAGLFALPSFWILRSGDHVTLETSRKIWRIPFSEVRDALTKLGDEICERLAGDLNRWDDAIKAWKQRNQADDVSLLAWSVGLERTLAQALIDEGSLEAPRDFDDAANDNDELRIAARMAGALPADQIRAVVSLARQFDRRTTNSLDILARDCMSFIKRHFENALPFQQGEAAANYVRETLRFEGGQKIGIFAFVNDLGIEIRHFAAEPPTLDGLAIWGSRHGPGVFLNESSPRILREGEIISASLGARVTLAHELCHLLLDGHHALSAVEVLKARMPVGVEQRAKSFAGEFLLPSRTAAEYWLAHGRPRHRLGLDDLVRDLIRTFGVTRSVAAWKLEHGTRDHDTDLGTILDSIAPRR